MMVIKLALLLLVAATAVTAESCGGRGTHIGLQIGSCNDDADEECALPTDTLIRLREEFILSANSAQIRVTGQALTPMGQFEVMTATFDNLIGGLEYAINQDIILGPQIGGGVGTFLLQIYDVVSEPSDYLEVCAIMRVAISAP